MKTIHYLLTVLLCLSGFTGAQAQSFVKYAEHSIWNDSYPIYDAVNYKGKFYAIQRYKEETARLIEFNVDPVNGTMRNTRSWDLEIVLGSFEFGSNTSTDCEMIEYNGSIYIFTCEKRGIYAQCWAYKFTIDENGKVTRKQIETPTFLPKTLHSTADVSTSLSATVYKGKLCIFYINNNSSKVQMGYTSTPDDPKSWQIRETIEQSIYANNTLTEDSWDVCTWYGEKNGKNTEMLVIGLIAGHNLWAYTYEGNLEDSKSRAWTATTLRNGTKDVPGFNLKLLQADIEGVGQYFNAVQFIYAIRDKKTTGGIHQRQVRTHCYYPNRDHLDYNNRGMMETNLPYGYFGAALVSCPYNAEKQVHDEKFGYGTRQRRQQYICILRGAADNHFKNDSHYAMIKSNMTSSTNYKLSSDSLLNDPELRKFCTLTAVVEGPPPAVIDNENMYDNVLPGPTDFISSLSMTTEQTKFVSEINTTTVSVNAGLGPDLDMFTLQALGGYEMNQDIETAKTLTQSYGKIYSNTDTQMASSGFHVYTVPTLHRYDFTYYDPTGIIEIRRPTLVSFIQTGITHTNVQFKLDDPKINPQIRVETPYKLENWPKRTFFKSMPTIFTFDLNALVGDEAKLKNQVEHSNSDDQTVKLGGEMKTPGFQVKGEYSFKVKKESKSILSEEVFAKINALSSKFYKYFERERLIKSYGLVCYFLNSPDQVPTATYYADLKRRGVMIEGEKPYILAWGVSNIKFDNMLKDAISTDNEAVTPEGNRVYNDGDALIVESAPGSHIQIYAISGHLEADRLSPDGSLRQPLSAGIYIVRISNGKDAKVYKAIKR